MNIEPQTVIYLCKTPLENDYQNQLTFANANAQQAYFSSNGVLFRTFGSGTGNGYTYVRKDSKIILDCKIDDVIGCNYLYYRNVGFSTKYYYCFITKMEYISEDSTAVYIETDVYQTYMFDISFHPCFVEREHVADDTAGLHTVPESIEYGEYQIADLRYSSLWENPQGTTSTPWLPCFCVTKFPNSFGNLTSDGKIQGDLGYIGEVFTSMKFFTVGTLQQAEWVIKCYDNDTQTTTDAIKNVFMIPRCCVNEVSSSTASYMDYNGVHYPLYPIYNYYESDEFNIQQPNVLAGNYQPKNAKLFCYPYSYFYATNNAGEEVTFRWEDFPIETIGSGTSAYTARTARYQKNIVPSCGLSAKLFFLNYKGYDSRSGLQPSQGTPYTKKLYSYGINFGKVPVCAWTTDYYTNWLTQNGVNVGMQALTGITTSAVTGAMAGSAIPVLGTVGGAFMGGLIGLLQQTTQATGQLTKAETTPPQAHGDINTGDASFAFKRNIINFYFMTIRPEMAAIVDNYFSTFGYKVNVVKTPQFNSRPNWNYIKTIGCNVEGNIPQEDLRTIRSMFDNGVTMWHNASTMYDYSQSNSVVQSNP